MKQFVTKTIREAGEALLDLFENVEVVYTKDALHDVVTEADLASQKILIDAIRKEYPDHGIVAEEEEVVHRDDADFVWYLDPLDGTRNYATRVPLYGINVGLVEKGSVILGAVYLPATDELCFAEKGEGAFINGEKASCSQQKTWEGSYGVGPIRVASPEGLELAGMISRISNGDAWMNCIASPAVTTVYMADGRRDWYISRGSKSWDYAAPSLIMKEAGCVVTNAAGEDWSPGDEELIVSNEYLHPELLGVFGG